MAGGGFELVLAFNVCKLLKSANGERRHFLKYFILSLSGFHGQGVSHFFENTEQLETIQKLPQKVGFLHSYNGLPRPILIHTDQSIIRFHEKITLTFARNLHITGHKFLMIRCVKKQCKTGVMFSSRFSL